jgi:hypothetical protein
MPSLKEVGNKRGLIETGTPDGLKTMLNIHQMGKIAIMKITNPSVNLRTFPVIF